MSGVRKIASAAVQLSGASRTLDRPIVTPIAPDEAQSHGLEDTYKQAYLEGFAAGEEDGRREAQRQASETQKQLEEALAEAEAVKRHWRERMRDSIEQFEKAIAQQTHVVERLAADVAEIAVCKIIGRLHAERRAIDAACRETLRALHIESAQVRVSTFDKEGFADLPPGIELVADASLEPGECVLRSPLGDIDAGLSTQLTQLRETLLAALAEGRA